jgi:hypothetical protein
MHELQDAIRAYEREHSKLPEKIDASVAVKYKLPVEGQPRRSRNAGPSSLQDVSNVDADEDSPSPHGTDGHLRATTTKTRYDIGNLDGTFGPPRRGGPHKNRWI